MFVGLPFLGVVVRGWDESEVLVIVLVLVLVLVLVGDNLDVEVGGIGRGGLSRRTNGRAAASPLCRG